jgi:hypothetical protein
MGWWKRADAYQPMPSGVGVMLGERRNASNATLEVHVDQHEEAAVPTITSTVEVDATSLLLFPTTASRRKALHFFGQELSRQPALWGKGHPAKVQRLLGLTRSFVPELTSFDTDTIPLATSLGILEGEYNVANEYSEVEVRMALPTHVRVSTTETLMSWGPIAVIH